MSGNRYALLVASDTFVDPRLTRLRAPAADAAALRDVLVDPAIGEFTAELSMNETEAVVRRRMAAFLANRTKDDVLLLHLSSHGVRWRRRPS